MERIYFGSVLVTLLYALFKYKNDSFSILTILCFYGGLAGYFGGIIENIYKLSLLALTIYLVLIHKPFNRIKTRENNVLIIFGLFSFLFLVSAGLNKTNFNLTFSQYSKFFVPFCMFFIIQYWAKYSFSKIEKIDRLLMLLLKIQIALSVVKVFTIGIQEWVVGSTAYTGGGIATPLPILGFVILWLNKKGELKRQDWIFAFALLFIGFVSLKRAVWFMMPLIVFLFMVYVPKRKLGKKILWIIPISLFIFYLGVRLDPTLNKERKRWGSFDLEYALNYTKIYSFGQNKTKYAEKDLAEGRGGVTGMLFEKLSDFKNLTWKDFLGFGLEEIVTRDYETFDQDKFNVHSKGSVTGVFKTYISNGLIGVFTFSIYLITLLLTINEKRIRYVLMGFILWDYFFYSGIVMTNQSLTFMFMFIAVFSNVQKRKEFIVNTKKRSNMFLSRVERNLATDT